MLNKYYLRLKTNSSLVNFLKNFECWTSIICVWKHCWHALPKRLYHSQDTGGELLFEHCLQKGLLEYWYLWEPFLWWSLFWKYCVYPCCHSLLAWPGWVGAGELLHLELLEKAWVVAGTAAELALAAATGAGWSHCVIILISSGFLHPRRTRPKINRVGASTIVVGLRAEGVSVC